MEGPQADYVTHLIATYGYIAIGCIIALESMGLPLPGESALVAAAPACSWAPRPRGATSNRAP